MTRRDCGRTCGLCPPSLDFPLSRRRHDAAVSPVSAGSCESEAFCHRGRSCGLHVPPVSGTGLRRWGAAQQQQLLRSSPERFRGRTRWKPWDHEWRSDQFFRSDSLRNGDRQRRHRFSDGGQGHKRQLWQHWRTLNQLHNHFGPFIRSGRPPWSSAVSEALSLKPPLRLARRCLGAAHLGTLSLARIAARGGDAEGAYAPGSGPNSG
jgi:hypothetical protein